MGTISKTGNHLVGTILNTGNYLVGTISNTGNHLVGTISNTGNHLVGTSRAENGVAGDSYDRSLDEKQIFWFTRK